MYLKSYISISSYVFFMGGMKQRFLSCNIMHSLLIPNVSFFGSTLPCRRIKGSVQRFSKFAYLLYICTCMDLSSKIFQNLTINDVKVLGAPNEVQLYNFESFMADIHFIAKDF